jgi:hypothetical protein
MDTVLIIQATGLLSPSPPAPAGPAWALLKIEASNPKSAIEALHE